MNSNISKYVGVALVAGILVTAGYLVKQPQTVREVVNQLGSVSSPDIMSPYFSFGGVRHWGYHTNFNSSASTTLCSFRTPASTSTVTRAIASAKTSTATALYLEWGVAAAMDATTTSLGKANVVSGAQFTQVASTTLGDFTSPTGPIDPNFVVGPNKYLNFKMAGSAIGPSLTGSCDAVFVQSY